MAFDDILEPKSSRYEERNALPPKPKPPTSSSKPPIESLLGDVDVGQFAKKLGLNDDLTKQVLVPLLAILDKHGGKVIDPESPTTQTLVSLSTMANEFGPLIQGAYQYFSGVKTQLDAADAALLDANAAALSASELNNLFGTEDDVGTVLQEEQQVQKTQPRPKSFGPDGGPNHAAPKSLLELGKIDYYSLLANDTISSRGVGSSSSDIYSQQQKNVEMTQQATTGWEKLPAKSSTIVPVNVLASENGMSKEEVKVADNQYRVNGGKPNETSIDLMSSESSEIIDEGRKDILSAMRQETKVRKMWSVDPADATPNMSAQDLVAHIKSQARPGQGGQTSTDAHSMRRKTQAFEMVGAKDAFNIAGAESLVANAFKVSGLAEAMAAERASVKSQQNTTTTSTTPSNALGADKSFISELQAAQSNQLTTMEAESSIVTGSDTSEWSMGSLNDLNSKDIGIEGIELEIPELDVSLSNEVASPDADALDRTPKRNQFRSSNSS